MSQREKENLKSKLKIIVLPAATAITDTAGTTISVLRMDSKFYTHINDISHLDANIECKSDMNGFLHFQNRYVTSKSVLIKPGEEFRRYSTDKDIYPIYIRSPDVSSSICISNLEKPVRIRIYMYWDGEKLSGIYLSPVGWCDTLYRCSIRTVYTNGVSIDNPTEIKDDVIYDDNVVLFPPCIPLFGGKPRGYGDLVVICFRYY